MDKAQLKLLQEFTALCKSNPAILHLPELSFYRDWLERLVLVYEQFINIAIGIILLIIICYK